MPKETTGSAPDVCSRVPGPIASKLFEGCRIQRILDLDDDSVFTWSRTAAAHFSEREIVSTQNLHSLASLKRLQHNHFQVPALEAFRCSNQEALLASSADHDRFTSAGVKHKRMEPEFYTLSRCLQSSNDPEIPISPALARADRLVEDLESPPKGSEVS